MRHPFRQPAQVPPGFGQRIPAKRLAQPHHHIQPAKFTLMRAKELSNRAFGQVPVYGALLRLPGYDQAEPGMLPAVRSDLDLEILTRERPPETKNGRKLVRLEQAIRSRKRINGCALEAQSRAALGTASPDHGTSAPGFHPDQETVSALAPGHRRLISTLHYASP